MIKPPVWLRDDGSPIACVEKIKVLDENFVEFGQVAQDMFDDALLMGCSESHMKCVLTEWVKSLVASF